MLPFLPKGDPIVTTLDDGGLQWPLRMLMPLKSGVYVFHGVLIMLVSDNTLTSPPQNLLRAHYYLRLPNGQLKRMKLIEFMQRLMVDTVSIVATIEPAYQRGSIFTAINVSNNISEETRMNELVSVLGMMPH